jgi:hypothetical protein
MHRSIFVGALISLGILVGGCSSSSDHPGSAGGSASGPAWTLSFQSSCLDGQDDQCVGKYGFSVSADGKYLVGPGPKGQKIEGKLAEADFSELNAKLTAVMATATFDASRGEAHLSDVPYESNDSITLSRQGRSDKIAHNSGADFAYATASADDALSLHKAIRDLAKSYYRLPFGNDCGDAALAVEALYSTVQGCNTDADCVYVDAQRGYGVIPPHSEQGILTEDCKAVRPLLAANKLQILSAAQKLIDANAEAAQVCGAEFYRTGCFYEQKVTSVAPACVANRCQARL